MKSVLSKIFTARSISVPAKKLFVFLAGCEKFLPELPPMEQIPKMGATPIEELFVELSDEGYILGNPRKYTLNYKKVRIEKYSTISPDAEGGEITVLALLEHYRKLHKKFRRNNFANASKDMIQLRFLIRQYTGEETKQKMVEFFADPKVKARHGEQPIPMFFSWALNKLRKKHGEPSEIPEQLGKVTRRK